LQFAIEQRQKRSASVVQLQFANCKSAIANHTMPDPKEIIVWVIAIPVAISFLAIALAHLPLRRDRATQPWGPALAIAAAFAAAFAGLRGKIAFPPRDAQTWLTYLGAIAVFVAIAATVAGTKRWRWPIVGASVVLIVATVWLLARSQIPIFGWQRFLIRAAVIAAFMIAWWILIERLAMRMKGAAATLPLILMITASVAALALVNAHSMFLGQLAGAVASALGAIMVSALWFKKLSITRGGVLALTVLLLGVIVAGHLFADLSQLELILLPAAPLATWLGELPMKSRRARFAVRITAVGLILLIPLVPALKGLRETMKEQTDSYMY
jgi:hypothetical protein